MREPRAAAAGVETVVKLGGGLLADAVRLDAVLARIAAAAPSHRLLVVPGGGPFADAVREVDRRLRLSDDAAHWMAVLAMDQHAHLIAARLTGAVLVADGPRTRRARLRQPWRASRACARALALAARGRPAPSFVGRDERQHRRLGCGADRRARASC